MAGDIASSLPARSSYRPSMTGAGLSDALNTEATDMLIETNRTHGIPATSTK
ncbi:hypothetical protein SAMN07250955_10852 [Arboricoccus pini]|uniref:Uncharacterized protein n=1 Tax=Arboricoccus pini TaxID=1963835 RepID=A0A212RFD7_9PROT|nr:hypothetical protein SAMN07250955_10852 [Arboricoccus pini]